MGKRGPKGQAEKKSMGAKYPNKQSRFVAPDYLSPIAKDYWKIIVEAFPSGYFTNSDLVLMEQYCEAAALHRNATKIISSEGRKYKDNKGVWRKHPSVEDQHQARCDCAMLATKLRLTKTSMVTPKAAGRAQQNTMTMAQDNEFEGLIYNPELMQQ